MESLREQTPRYPTEDIDALVQGGADAPDRICQGVGGQATNACRL